MVRGRGDDRFGGAKARLVHAVAAAGLLLPAAPSLAAGAPAGATIVNTAYVSHREAGETVVAASNAIATTVAEMVDFSVTFLRAQRLTARTEALAFRLLNLGNSRRAFVLSLASVAGFDASSCKVYLDPTGREDFVLANVALYDPARPPELDPGAAMQVWTVCDSDASVVGQVSLEAWPTTRSSDTGAGVVWVRRTARALGEVATPSTVFASLNKSQVVLDRKGGTRALPGSTITYTLDADIQGSGVARGAMVTDPIPAGSTYVAGSLQLDGQALSDLADADAGELAGGQITVRLGDVVAPAKRTVTFKVVINAQESVTP